MKILYNRTRLPSFRAGIFAGYMMDNIPDRLRNHVRVETYTDNTIWGLIKQETRIEILNT